MKLSADIHDYARKYNKIIERLDRSKIAQKNKTDILEFDKACQLERLSIARRIKIINTLILIAERYLKIIFSDATKDDLKKFVLKIESIEEYSPWTKHDYKAILKKFYKWLVFGDNYRDRIDYPEIISWLRVSLSRREQPKVQASDILTEKEIEKLIKTAEHPRDKAFFSVLYELGARIGEIGGLTIKDVSRDDYGFLIDLSGKTGMRTPRIIESASYLTAWLNDHPLKENPQAPLWVMIGDRNKNRKMDYGAFRALVLRTTEKAKIKKRIYPHLFRHTRVTHLLTNKQINESHAKVYFGWTPDSNMLSEYSHLVSRDVNDVMLEIYGIKTTDNKKEPKVKQCPKCKTIVNTVFSFCPKCSSILDLQTAISLDEQRKDTYSFENKLLAEDPEIQEVLLKKVLKMGLGKELMRIYFKNKNL